MSVSGSPLIESDLDQSEPVSSAVVHLVATVSNTRIEDLPPLYEVIDPDALDAILDRPNAGGVTFHYNGYDVHVTADRHVSLYDGASDAPQSAAFRPVPDGADRHVPGRGRADSALDGTGRDREAQFHLLVESIENYAIFMLDTDGRVTSWNPGARNIKGYREDEILGEHFSVFYPDEEVERGVPARNLADARIDGRVEDEGWRVRKDGSRFYANVTISTIHDEDGRLRGFVKVTRDMTNERHRREIERQKERLEEFSNVVAHDLRNPLSVARAHLDLLENDDDDHREAVEQALDRMDEIIADLLTLARQGLTVEADAVVDLASVARDAWTTVDGPNGSGDATLTVGTELEFAADRSRLQELLENLFANALDHGGEGVTVGVGDLPDGTGFYVEDDGPGIPEDEREDVFEAGYSTSESGTGFGLDIVERIADAHGWEVRLTESEAGGARFEVAGVDVRADP